MIREFQRQFHDHPQRIVSYLDRHGTYTAFAAARSCLRTRSKRSWTRQDPRSLQEDLGRGDADDTCAMSRNPPPSISTTGHCDPSRSSAAHRRRDVSADHGTSSGDSCSSEPTVSPGPSTTNGIAPSAGRTSRRASLRERRSDDRE